MLAPISVFGVGARLDKEDEEELEEAFKAYIDKSGEGSKRRQIHDAMSHDWKSSLPTRLKKAFFERKKRKESEGDDDSGDEDFDKAEKYAWIGDKMRFGSGGWCLSCLYVCCVHVFVTFVCVYVSSSH